MVFHLELTDLFLSLSLALALRTLFSRSTSDGSRFVDPALPDLRSDPDLLNAASDDDGPDPRLA